MRLFENRSADKQVTVGIFPDGRRAIIKARDLDKNCNEVHLLRNEDSPENEDRQIVDDGVVF